MYVCICRFDIENVTCFNGVTGSGYYESKELLYH